jgi:hypothetical protein
MDPVAILADVGYALSIAKVAIAVEQSAAPFVETAYNLISGNTTLTDAQRADLQTQEDALRAQLDVDPIAADQA